MCDRRQLNTRTSTAATLNLCPALQQLDTWLAHRYAPTRTLDSSITGHLLWAQERNSSRQVVIKCVCLRAVAQLRTSRGRTDDPFVEKEIVTRLRAAGAHPNLLHHYEEFVEPVSEQGDPRWIALSMEYCPAGDLLDLLEQQPRGRLDEYQALEIVEQVASGVAHLHGLGIAHRNLSLENVMVHDRTCKIRSFGLCVDVKEECHGPVGSVFFMAPEMASGGPYDPVKTDIWALGVIFFALLTGLPLITCASPGEQGFTLLSNYGVVALLEHWGVTRTMSTETIGLLSSMLEFNPARRLCRVREVLHHRAMAMLRQENGLTEE